MRRFDGLKCACALLVCLVALFSCVPPTLAQSASTGALTGTVTDPSGAVISGATVTATNLATGQSRDTTTDASGLYKLFRAATWKLQSEVVRIRLQDCRGPVGHREHHGDRCGESQP